MKITNVKIDKTNIEITYEPEFIERLFKKKAIIKKFKLLNRTFKNFPGMICFIDMDGNFNNPLSTETKLVSKEYNKMRYL